MSAMTEYIALLRGINVGGKAKLSMAHLREALTAEGFTDVRTLLQSGNVVLDATRTTPGKLEARLEKLIEDRFELTVPCLVRTGRELRDALAVNPLAELADDGSKMMVIFLSAEPDPELLVEHDPDALDPGRIVHRGREIYQWCPNGLREAPPVAAFVERKLKIKATARNWNTATKLQAMLRSASS
jgi:uncharacterized protein (DUF1697 family)